MPTAKEIIDRLRAKNPQMTDAQIIVLLCEHIDATQTNRDLHGFLVSGYARGVAYCDKEENNS